QPSASGADLVVHALAGDKGVADNKEVAGNKEQRVAHVDGRIGGVSWSPDSTRIAFTTATGGQNELLVAGLAGGSPAPIVKSTEPINGPSWTPDGANVTYAVGGGGGGPIQHQVSPPEIGPKLIFVATENGRGAPGTSYLVPAAGGSPRTIHSAGGRGGGGG